MSERPDYLRRAFSEEELDALFRDFPHSKGASELLPGSWTYEKNPLSKTEAYTVRHGLPHIDFEKYTRFEILTWQAVIPEALLPGQTGNQIVRNFEPFIFDTIPRFTGFPLADNQRNTIAKNREKSKAKMKSSNGEERQYVLGKEDEYIQFLLDFCRNQAKIQALFIETNLTGNKQGDYTFGIKYDAIDESTGNLEFLVQEQLRKYNPWNEQVMQYVLRTHAKHDDLQHTTPAALATIIKQLAAKT